MAHVQTNNVEEHNKRVSFGGEKQLIVYDDGVGVDSEEGVQHATRHNTSFTESDAPPSKVKVTSGNKEIPRPISPPAQIEELNPVTSIVSPPLPSLMKRMESETVENPFRPTETLYHEVDPIVEAYRQRPFPPSPSNSPVPPHATSTSTPLRHGHHFHENVEQESASSTKLTNHELSYSTTEFSTSTTPTGKNNKSSSKKSNGGRNSRTSSLAEARTQQNHPNSQNASLVGTTTTSGPIGDLPPPSKAEIVHIDEKKKRCACCSLQ
jgi:hypothetical protein